jgi:hypothetical protein
MGMYHYGKPPGPANLPAYPDTGSVFPFIDPGGNLKGFHYFIQFPFVTFRFVTENSINTIIAPKVKIVGVVSRRMNFFSGKNAHVQIDAPVGFYGFQGRFVEPVIRYRQKIEPRLTVIGGNYSRRFLSVRTVGMHMGISPERPQFE